MNLDKHPCSFCGKPCYRIAYIGRRLACAECFRVLAVEIALLRGEGVSDLRFCAECACGYEWQEGWGALCGGCRRAEILERERDVALDRITALETERDEALRALERGDSLLDQCGREHAAMFVRVEAAEAERDEAQARLSSIGGYEGYDDALERLRKQRNQLLIGSLETTVALLDAEVIFPADFSPELRRRLVRALKGDTE